MKNLKTYFNEIIEKNPEVSSYRKLRATIGSLGILLPILLFISTLIYDDIQFQPSISHFYYTKVNFIFAGITLIQGLFLITYKGYSRLDNWLTNLAGFSCIGIVIFPTNCLIKSITAGKTNFFEQVIIPHIIKGSELVENIHYISAGVFFVLLAIISIFQFTKTDKRIIPRNSKKYKRNLLYRTCGIVMLLCCLLIVMDSFVFNFPIENHITFFLEALALFAFGLSWITKGEQILEDKK